MRLKTLLLLLFTFCALQSGAQNYISSEEKALLDSIDTYISQGKVKDAERVSIKILSSHPGDKTLYPIWDLLGMLRSNLNDTEGALEALDVAATLAPEKSKPEILYKKARLHHQINRPDLAMKDLDASIEMDSTNLEARRLRGLTLISLKEPEKAMIDFDYYERIAGQDATLQHGRGLYNIEKGNPEGAMANFRNSYNLQASDIVLIDLLKCALLYDDITKYEEDIREGLKRYPRNGNLYLIRAAYNKKRFQTDAMESDLRTAKEFGADAALLRYVMSSEDNPTKNSYK